MLIINKLQAIVNFIQNIEITYGGGLAIFDIMVWIWFIYCCILSLIKTIKGGNIN